MIIRQARLSDVPEIAAIHVESWNGSGENATIDQRTELWHHLLGGGARRTQVWVALDDLGEVIGFAAAGAARVLKERYDGEITAIYVARNQQLKGIGRALVREIFGWFKSHEYLTAMSWVPADCEVRAFVRKMGAESLADRRIVGTGDRAVAEVAMAWRLPQD